MATYVYETIDRTQPLRRFELRQSMKDAPLTQHPETGEPILRVISGGFGYMSKGTAPAGSSGGHSCGSGGCRCH